MSVKRIFFSARLGTCDDPSLVPMSLIPLPRCALHLKHLLESSVDPFLTVLSDVRWHRNVLAALDHRNERAVFANAELGRERYRSTDFV